MSGLFNTVVVPAMALGLAWAVYTWPGAEDRPETLGHLWRWLASSSDGLVEGLGVLAGSALSLFLATQVGAAVSRGSDVRSSAQVVGLEALTSVVCLTAALISWLAVPGIVSGPHVTGVGIGVGLFVPLLCTWLFAFVRPSSASLWLAQTRAERHLPELDRMLMDLQARLPLEGGRVLGSRARDGRRIIGQVWRLGGVLGAMAAAVAGVVTLGDDPLPDPLRLTSALVVVAALTAGTFALFAYHVKNLIVLRLLESRWVVALVGGVGVLGAALQMIVLGVTLWQAQGAVGLLLGGVIFALPAGVALLRLRSSSTWAWVYRDVRGRGADVLRARRAVMQSQRVNGCGQPCERLVRTIAESRRGRGA